MNNLQHAYHQTSRANNFNVPENVTQDFDHDINSYRPLITDEEIWYLNLYVNGLCCGMVALFGTANNIVNMWIFRALGLMDSMSVCLFSLALTDFLLSLVVFISRAFPIWDTFFSQDDIDPMAIWYAGFEWVAASLFNCSGWITTYLALERCVCVTFPFKVKEIFTRQRSIVVVVFIYLCNAALYIPIYVTQRLEWVDEEERVGINETIVRSRLLLKFSNDHEDIVYYVDIITGYILPFSSLTIILGSVLWMIHGLKMSTKLRESMASRTDDTTWPKEASRLSYKTRKLVRIVLILAIIFTACMIPRAFAMNMCLLYPEVKHDGKERNMYNFQWHFTHFSSVINASVNIFVYVIINSSYRARFKTLFRFL